MIKNNTLRIWVNRILAFLAGGLLIFIILQVTVVTDATGKNEDLTRDLDEIQFAPGRLLDEGKTYYGKYDYRNAKRVLNTLFEKHPNAKETAEGKVLYAEIEKKHESMDNKWDTAVPGLREEWEKAMAIQWKEELNEQFKKDKEKLEKDMENNLEKEWNNVKDQIRTEWEKEI